MVKEFKIDSKYLFYSNLRKKFYIENNCSLYEKTIRYIDRNNMFDLKEFKLKKFLGKNINE